jgi:hypothetical protein
VLRSRAASGCGLRLIRWLGAKRFCWVLGQAEVEAERYEAKERACLEK